MGILISSSVIPIAMSILWARATSYGLVSGVVGGCLSGMAAWLSYASTFPGGLSAATFVKNTGEELPMLTAILKQLKKNAKEGQMEDRSQNEALMQDMQQKSHSIDSRPIIKSGLGYKIINKHLDLTNTPSL